MIWICREYSQRKDNNGNRQSYAETETVENKVFADEIDKVGVERKFKEIINFFLRLHRISNDRYQLSLETCTWNSSIKFAISTRESKERNKSRYRKLVKKTRPLHARSTTELKRFFLFFFFLSFYFLNFVIVVHGSVVTQRWSISFKAVDLRRHLSLNFWNIRNALALLSREEDSPSDWTDSLVSFYRFHGVLNKNLALKHLFASKRVHTYNTYI